MDVDGCFYNTRREKESPSPPPHVHWSRWEGCWQVMKSGTAQRLDRIRGCRQRAPLGVYRAGRRGKEGEDRRGEATSGDASVRACTWAAAKNAAAVNEAMGAIGRGHGGRCLSENNMLRCHAEKPKTPSPSLPASASPRRRELASKAHPAQEHPAPQAN
jgi:hypothetical protein